MAWLAGGGPALLGVLAGGALLHWLGDHHGAHWDPTMIAITAVLIVAGAATAWVAFRDPEAAEKRLSGRPGAMRADS